MGMILDDLSVLNQDNQKQFQNIATFIFGYYVFSIVIRLITGTLIKMLPEEVLFLDQFFFFPAITGASFAIFLAIYTVKKYQTPHQSGQVIVSSLVMGLVFMLFRIGAIFTVGSMIMVAIQDDTQNFVTIGEYLANSGFTADIIILSVDILLVLFLINAFRLEQNKKQKLSS